MIFLKNIITGKINLDITIYNFFADKDQSDLLNDFIDFKKITKPKDREKKK